MTKNQLFLALLIFIAGISVSYHLQRDKDRERALTEKLQKSTDELERQLEETRSEIQRQAGYRDSLCGLTDSLFLRVGGLTAYNLKLGKELAKIKGRYKDVPVDSLSAIMNNRADKWKKEK